MPSTRVPFRITWASISMARRAAAVSVVKKGLPVPAPKITKEHVSEDQVKDGERDLQDLTDKYIAVVDKHLATKEKEIMTV